MERGTERRKGEARGLGKVSNQVNNHLEMDKRFLSFFSFFLQSPVSFSLFCSLVHIFSFFKVTNICCYYKKKDMKPTKVIFKRTELLPLLTHHAAPGAAGDSSKAEAQLACPPTGVLGQERGICNCVSLKLQRAPSPSYRPAGSTTHCSALKWHQ